ncbi:MAG: glycosyltransferase family 39 protein, partial [bacterium]|nr:glycosyltransferase family 39 protein [bacterium]
MKRLSGLLTDHIWEVILIVIFGFLFFYRLDWVTLGSWDEAWYGSIARTISQSNEWMLIEFNGRPFFDHPPMGFWLMAVSYKLFGISEFTTRLPSALLGFVSMILLYKTSILLFGKRVVGFAAALILGTSVWYVLRVRSGNLDSPFVFFYILTIYLSLLSRKNMKLFPLTMVSFGALMLTKTLVGASALPIIGLLLFSQLLNIVKNWKWILAGLASFAIVVLPWYMIQKETYSNFIEHHFFTIGTRGNSAASYLQLEYELPLFYLHMGIRKWYKLWLVSGGVLLITLRFLRPKVLIVLLWNAVILYPFLTT